MIQKRLHLCSTHWGRDQIAFRRWHFQIHFLEWKCMNFGWNFVESLFLMVHLKICQHWFRNGLKPTRRQAIIWTDNRLLVHICVIRPQWVKMGWKVYFMSDVMNLWYQDNVSVTFYKEYFMSLLLLNTQQDSHISSIQCACNFAGNSTQLATFVTCHEILSALVENCIGQPSVLIHKMWICHVYYPFLAR